MPFTPRVFSGIQPSGDLHLGNYLGAIKRFVPLQQQYECLYCVVDEHAITVWQEPADLRRKTREVAAAYVATGVDPKQHIIFNQSRVYQHAEARRKTGEQKPEDPETELTLLAEIRDLLAAERTARSRSGAGRSDLS